MVKSDEGGSKCTVIHVFNRQEWNIKQEIKKI